MAIYAVEDRYVPEDDKFWFLLVDITVKETDINGILRYKIISKHETHREATDSWIATQKP